jgi:hypothetical protein
MVLLFRVLVDSSEDANVSEKHTVSIFRAEVTMHRHFSPEDGDGMFL